MLIRVIGYASERSGDPSLRLSLYIRLTALRNMLDVRIAASRLYSRETNGFERQRAPYAALTADK